MGKMLFGNDQSYDCIVDVALKGANQEALCLAHQHTKTFFIAGVWVSDDGYVLGIKGDKNSYYPMPTAAETKDFQANSLLPDPLPEYSIATIDYLFGYSLWIIIVGLIVGGLIKARFFPDSEDEGMVAEYDGAVPGEGDDGSPPPAPGG